MYKYFKFIKEFHNNNPKEIDFINNQLSKHLLDNKENQTEIEIILDFLFSNPKIDISKIGYKTILEKTEKRHKKLQSVSSKDNEKEGVDYEIILDFKNGFKFVKLVSKNCYNREGKLMSHCVASYYGRNTKIYSLRDKQNNPHCTIEEGQQVKGKGNGKIDPKYVDYVVKFLEKLGMTVGENEMKNLGYYKLDKIDSDLKCDKLYNGYVYEGNLDKIKDSNGEIYNGFGLLNVKELIDFDLNMKFKINIDIKGTVEYFLNKMKNISIIKKIVSKKNKAVNGNSGTSAVNGNSGTSAVNGDYGTSAVNGNYGTSAVNGDSGKSAVNGDYGKSAVNGYSGTSAVNGDYGKSAVNGDSGKSAVNGDYGKSAVNGYSGKSAVNGDSGKSAVNGDYGKSAVNGYSGTSAVNGYSGKSAVNGDYGTSAVNGNYGTSAVNGYSGKSAVNGDYGTSAVNGNYGTIELNGKECMGVVQGKCGKIKGKIGNRITLSEIDDYGHIICVKSTIIDGNKIKEDTLYTLENKKFIEVK